VTLDPVASANRGYISEVYGSYGSYEEAGYQLEIGFSLDPKNANFLLNSAFLQSGFNPGTKRPEDSKRAFAKYIENLIRSLELSQSELLKYEEVSEKEMLYRSWIHYRLAGTYHYLDEYEKAIHNYIIAKNLMPDDKRSHFIAEFDLGEAYLDNGSYAECEELYRKLIEELEEIIKNKSQNPIEETASAEKAGSEYGYEDVTIGYMIGYAGLNLAFSYLERDANLVDALTLTEKAKSYTKPLQDGKRKRQLMAMYADRRGWMLYKQVKLGNGFGGINEAIDCLKRAVCMNADPHYYLHLALALEHKLDTDDGNLHKTNTEKNDTKRNFPSLWHAAITQ
jgi:tetratricopeptide (TPR) repeat protein